MAVDMFAISVADEDLLNDKFIQELAASVIQRTNMMNTDMAQDGGADSDRIIMTRIGQT